MEIRLLSPPAIAAQFVFFLCHNRLQKHDRCCFPLWALDALKKMEQFLGRIFPIPAGREQPGCPIDRFDRHFEAARNCHQRDRLGFALLIKKFVDYRAIQVACARTIRLGPPIVNKTCSDLVSLLYQAGQIDLILNPKKMTKYTFQFDRLA